jgi:hypothetical protein
VLSGYPIDGILVLGRSTKLTGMLLWNEFIGSNSFQSKNTVEYGTFLGEMGNWINKHEWSHSLV